MSAELLAYLVGVFAILAYSAYIDTDEPLSFLFLSVVWPLALVIAVPVAFGYAVRWFVKGGAK